MGSPNTQQQALRTSRQREIVGKEQLPSARRAVPAGLRAVGRGAVPERSRQPRRSPRIRAVEPAAAHIQPVCTAEPGIETAGTVEPGNTIILDTGEQLVVFARQRRRQYQAAYPCHTCRRTGRQAGQHTEEGGRCTIISIGGTVETVRARRGHPQPADALQRRFLPHVERNRRVNLLRHQVESQRRDRHGTAAQRSAQPQRRGRFVNPDFRRSHLQVGIHDNVLPGVGIQVPDSQGFVTEIMDTEGIGTAGEHVEQLIPAAASGRGIILRIGRLMDGHHGHAFDRAVLVDDPSADRSGRHLRSRRQTKPQQEKEKDSFHIRKDNKKMPGYHRASSLSNYAQSS